MKEFTLDSVIEEAKKLGSYFVTITTKDKGKSDGDLNHYAFRKEFPTDDIVPSLDKCVSSLNIRPEQPVPVVKPPTILEDKKPLRIAIITHFNRCPDSYSPGRAVKNQIKLLQKYGHEVVFFTQEGSVLDVGCELRAVVPKFKREKNIVNEEIKLKFIDVLREQLVGFDLAITHDFYIDDCITYREAVKECGVPIKWMHWARSGVGHPIDFNMPNARYVYMNYSDAGRFAKNIGVNSDRVRVVFNEKDPSLFNSWDPITTMVSNRMKLWTKDIIQTLPVCTTRLDAKGINSVISVFGQLKKQGKKVALIVCNSNGRRRVDEINSKIKFALEVHGLTEEDFIFTSTLATSEYNIESEVPNKVVAQLQGISNLFIFPTIAEVCPNILLEAAMSKNLIVINEDLPLLMDFCDEKFIIKYPFTSNRSVHYHGRDDESLKILSKQIIGQIESNKSDRMLRYVWRRHCVETVYNDMLKPVLYE